MPLKESSMHPFTGVHRYLAQCHTAVDEYNGKTIVLCTEAPDNTGTSVTHAAE